YSEAETLYRDDFLAEHPFEDWIGPRREFLRQRYLTTVGRLIEMYRAGDDHVSVIAASQRLLRRDPTNEPISRRLMQSHCAQGQRHLAAAEFHRCETALRRELELKPSTETIDLFSRIRAN
ncbi:MAG: AfsR/SARP family transcriptional regulator, partial [Acidimicrobiales bacterium]